MSKVHLSTLLVITNAERALVVETVSPEATDLNVGLRHVLVGKEEPKTEDWLGKNVKDGVGDDLSVNAGLAGAIGDTPDTRDLLVTWKVWKFPSETYMG